MNYAFQLNPHAKIISYSNLLSIPILDKIPKHNKFHPNKKNYIDE